MDFDDMKKDKDFQKWCFDTDLVGNKNWFNLENGSGDEVYIAYEAWVAGQQSKQPEIDELRKRLNVYEREGYKLVPVDLIERCVSHIGIASCHPANSLEDDQKMDTDIDALEKAMIGVCYDH